MMKNYPPENVKPNLDFLKTNFADTQSTYRAQITKITKALNLIEEEKTRESALKTLKELGEKLESIHASMVSYEMAMCEMEHPRVVFSDKAIKNRKELQGENNE